MHTLKAWSARRAGANITVTGKSAIDGSDTKITGVVSIEPRRGGLVIATDKDGEEHSLVE
jgi:hypothetical protein